MQIKIFNSHETDDLETEINDWLSKNKSSIIIKDIQIRPYATAHSGHALGYALYDIKIGEVPKEIQIKMQKITLLLNIRSDK